MLETKRLWLHAEQGTPQWFADRLRRERKLLDARYAFSEESERALFDFEIEGHMLGEADSARVEFRIVSGK